MEACISNDPTPIYSGDASYYGAVDLFCSGYNEECACIQSSGTTCYFYRGGIASNCNNVLTTYSSSLHGAVAFDIIATLGVFVVGILTCVTICCPQNFGAQPTPAGQVITTPGPSVVVQQPAPVQYGQPQYAQGTVVTGVVIGQAQPVPNKY